MAAMKGNAGILFLTATLVIVVGLSSFVGYKLYQRHQAKKMQRWEARGPLNLRAPLSPAELQAFLESENARIDRYEVLRPVVDQLDLVGFWQLSGPEQALEQLKTSTGFREGEEAGTVIFVASDRDQTMAGRLREEVLRSYQDVLRRESFMPSFAPQP